MVTKAMSRNHKYDPEIGDGYTTIHHRCARKKMTQNILPIIALLKKTFMSTQRVVNTPQYRASAIKVTKDLQDSELEEHSHAKSWLSNILRCARDLIILLPHPISQPPKNGPVFTYDLLQKLAEEIEEKETIFTIDANNREWTAGECCRLFKIMVALEKFEEQEIDPDAIVLKDEREVSLLQARGLKVLAENLARSYTACMLSTLNDLFIRSALIAPKMKGARAAKRKPHRS